MAYHTMHDFGTSTLLKEKSSDHLKNLYEMKLVTNFYVNLTSFL